MRAKSKRPSRAAVTGKTSASAGSRIITRWRYAFQFSPVIPTTNAPSPIVLWTPLEIVWKGLIVASSVAFFAIPPITWRHLQRTHESEVHQ